MRNTELIRQADRIYALISEGETRFAQDDELRSHLAKYICILCSGYLENAVYNLYNDWVFNKSPHEYIKTYVGKALNKIQNPNSEKLREISKAFNPDWEVALTVYMSSEERSTAINYIIRDRHKIAHGSDSEITLMRIKNFFDKAVDVMTFIENQLDENE